MTMVCSTLNLWGRLILTPSNNNRGDSVETMYHRIKRMTPEEMQSFVYWVYKCGNEDGKMGLEDSPPDALPSYFGGAMLTYKAKQVMPHDNVNDLWDNFEAIYNRKE